MTRKSHVRAALFVGVAASALASTEAFAQAASSSGGQPLEEVVVTATR